MARGFRSDQAKVLYDEAIRQGWWPPKDKGKSGHFFLRCPARRCAFEVPFSTTGKYNPRELKNQIAIMRRHGMVWQGRGGEHVAPRLNHRVRALSQ